VSFSESDAEKFLKVTRTPRPACFMLHEGLR
jgi:hypothetical protein